MSYYTKKKLYFQQQGLEVFLRNQRQNSWFHLFTNSTRGYAVPELLEFYDNDFDELLGVSVEGFDVCVRENKNVLDAEQLLELT